MFKYLENIIKKMKGNVLTIGIDDILIEAFNKNNSVEVYSISENNNKVLSGKSKKLISNKGKKINIKKLKKYLNKKSSDYIICNMEILYKYYKHLIRETIYLNSNILYIYSTNDYDKEFIINKYKRYNVKINVLDYKNGFILEIDNSNSKNNFIKDKIYFIKDSMYNLAEAIGNILIS